MKRQPRTHQASSNRSGFSLIELLVVIVIIGILMALILPAIGGARIRARETAVSTEITQLDQAIVSFKARFGIEPPSSLTIPTSVTGWSAADRQKITRIWGQFDFATLGGLDLNTGDPATNYPTSEFHLNGAECLVFFLGGINGSGSPSSPQLIGFSKNPRTPWSVSGANRDVPFFDGFDIDRLVDIDGDNAVEFLDGLPDQKTPYIYFSSQGKSYRVNNNAGLFDDFDVHGGPTNTSDMSSVYVGANGTTPLRANGYQIISPGLDGLYGIGGVYTNGGECVGSRAAEADNITNFSGGRLKK